MATSGYNIILCVYMYTLYAMLSTLIVIKNHTLQINFQLPARLDLSKFREAIYQAQLPFISIDTTRAALITLILYEVSSKRAVWTSESFFFLATLMAAWILLSSASSTPGFNYKLINFSLLPVSYLLLSLRMLEFSNNLFMYIFLIELIGYSFYFQFFGLAHDKHEKTRVKSVDLLLLYFWSSFLTTILFVYYLLNTVTAVNTTMYSELALVHSSSLSLIKYGNIFVVALGIKFGIAGLHMLKAELYKFLKYESIVVFTVLTMIVYIQFFLFLKAHYFVLFALFSKILVIILFFLTIVTLFVLYNNNDNISVVLALSSVVNTTLLYMYLLN